MRVARERWCEMGAYIVVALLAGVVLGLCLRRAGRAFRAFRGMRVLTCPENRQPAAVELKGWHAGVGAVIGNPALQVRKCSRWPERAGCDQACIREVRTAPATGLIQTIVMNWCQYNRCACCGAPLAKLRVGPHQPHLIDRELRIFEWKQIPP